MSKIRVVLVDDEDGVLELMKLQLSCDERFDVVGVGHNGREALRLANALRPDVMVLDITMPLLNGVEACARITAAFPATAVLIATGNRGEEFVREARRAGATDLLEKPLSQETLIEGVVWANDKRDLTVPRRGFASVWAFYGAKATAGASTLAVNTALDLAGLGYNTLLVDLDSAAGDCARYLGQTLTDQGPDFFSRVAQLPKLDADAVGRLIGKVTLPVTPRLTLDAILSAGQLSAPVLHAGDTLRELFDLLITKYDYVILDLPPGRLFDIHVGAALDFAERFFVVTNTESSALRAVHAMTSALETSGFSLERLTLVLSGLVVQTQFDARQWLVDHKVPLQQILAMPLDARVCSAALQRGLPVLFGDPKSLYAQFVHALVDHALNRPPATGTPTTLWG